MHRYQTTEVYVSLMSMMRIEYDGISAMEFDEEVNETIGITAETEQFESEQQEEENNLQEKKPDRRYKYYGSSQLFWHIKKLSI